MCSFNFMFIYLLYTYGNRSHSNKHCYAAKQQGTEVDVLFLRLLWWKVLSPNQGLLAGGFFNDLGKGSNIPPVQYSPPGANHTSMLWICFIILSLQKYHLAIRIFKIYSHISKLHSWEKNRHLDIGLRNNFWNLSPQVSKQKKNKQTGLYQAQKLLHSKGNYQQSEKAT